MRVRWRKFAMPDGTIKKEEELTGDQRRQFAQKITDYFTPIWYEAVMRDMRQEREKAASS